MKTLKIFMGKSECGQNNIKSQGRKLVAIIFAKELQFVVHSGMMTITFWILLLMRGITENNRMLTERNTLTYIYV